MKRNGSIVLALSIGCFLWLSLITPIAAEAAYSIGFSNRFIDISSPQQSNLDCSGTITVTGSSCLPAVWFCTRGPSQELAAYKAEVENGHFSIDIPLRFGEGQYTIWAGDNGTRFDGSIRFLVTNINCADNRFSSASNYINSDDERIAALAEELNLVQLGDREKVQVIHDWIAANIEYDCAAYFEHRVELNSATAVLEQRKGLCRDFSFLFAALSRHCGVPCKVVYGQVCDGNNDQSRLHAWNEVLIDDEWECVDVTWDAGYITGSRFVQSPSSKYLTPDRTFFARSHSPTLVTAH